jgi:hypothetical protein
MAFVAALAVSGFFFIFRISTHPCQASEGIQSGMPIILLVVD